MRGFDDHPPLTQVQLERDGDAMIEPLAGLVHPLQCINTSKIRGSDSVSLRS